VGESELLFGSRFLKTFKLESWMEFGMEMNGKSATNSKPLFTINGKLEV
jgi:hypothetical protein